MSVNIEKQRKVVEAVKREEAEMHTQAVNVKTNDVIMEDFDLAELEEIDVRHKNMSASIKGFGCITIINHDRCGRRIHLENAIWRGLGCPKFVRVFLKPKKVFVTAGTNTGIAVKFDRTMDFEKAVKDYQGKIVLYATETVKRLTAEWNLEFDSNCCYTGGTHKKCTINGTPAIVITKDDVVEVAEATSADAVDGFAESNSVDTVGGED